MRSFLYRASKCRCSSTYRQVGIATDYTQRITSNRPTMTFALSSLALSQARLRSLRTLIMISMNENYQECRLFVCFYIKAVSCLFLSMSLAMDLKSCWGVIDIKKDAQEPMLEINEQYEQCVGLIGRNMPTDFYIPFGRLRIGKIIGRGAFGSAKSTDPELHL